MDGNPGSNLNEPHKFDDPLTCRRDSSIEAIAWSPDRAAEHTTVWLSDMARGAIVSHLRGSEPGNQPAQSYAELAKLVGNAGLKVRQAINTFRCLPESGSASLSSFLKHATASLMDQACVASRYLPRFDGFLTSWHAFDMSPAPQLFTPPTSPTDTHNSIQISNDKDSSMNPVAPNLSHASTVTNDVTANLLQPIIHSLVPRTSIASKGPVMVSTTTRAGADGSQLSLQHEGPEATSASHDGLMLYFTVPAAAEQQLRDSILVKALLPQSTWL